MRFARNKRGQKYPVPVSASHRAASLRHVRPHKEGQPVSLVAKISHGYALRCDARICSGFRGAFKHARPRYCVPRGVAQSSSGVSRPPRDAHAVRCAVGCVTMIPLVVTLSTRTLCVVMVRRKTASFVDSHSPHRIQLHCRHRLCHLRRSATPVHSLTTLRQLFLITA